MSDTPAPTPALFERAPQARLPEASLRDIFICFLIIGATSFGGGVLAYLRASLVERRKWLTDDDFVELLSICQTLPGLNSSNMAILVGDRLHGSAGAAVALAGICLPGGLLMMAAASAYEASQGAHDGISAILHGVSAGAVGLVFAVTFQLGRKALDRWMDAILVALTVVGVNVLHLPILLVLAVIGVCGILWYRPGHLPGADGKP